MVAGDPQLVGVQVRLRASEDGETWRSWAKGTSDDDGIFTLTKSDVDEGDLFYISVEIKLDNSSFEFYDNPDAMIGKPALMALTEYPK